MKALSFWRKFRHRFQPWYWFKSKYIRRDHLLDLRNPEYRWGWVDRSERLVYANFNLLKEFIERERPFETFCWGDCPSKGSSDGQDPCSCQTDPFETEHAAVRRQQKADLLLLYRYWTADRAVLHQNIDNALHAWAESRHVGGKDFFDTINEPPTPESERLFAELQRLEKDEEDRLDRYLVLLVGLRRVLWT